jgi:hypothetical protein
MTQNFKEYLTEGMSGDINKSARKNDPEGYLASDLMKHKKTMDSSMYKKAHKMMLDGDVQGAQKIVDKFKGSMNEGDMKAIIKDMDGAEYRELKDSYNSFMDGFYGLTEIMENSPDPEIRKDIAKILKSPDSRTQLGKLL